MLPSGRDSYVREEEKTFSRLDNTQLYYHSIKIAHSKILFFPPCSLGQVNDTLKQQSLAIDQFMLAILRKTSGTVLSLPAVELCCTSGYGSWLLFRKVPAKHCAFSTVG